MTRQIWRPSNMLYPVPAVMISCMDEDGRTNIMTAAWAGTVCSDPVMVSVSIRPSRYSHSIIVRTGEFVINLTDRQLVRAADFCGVRSGRDVDKFDYLHLTPLPSAKVRAPGISESPVCLECKVRRILHPGSHDIFLSEVMAVSVDEKFMDADGRLDLQKADLVAWSHGEYYALGDRIGQFGFSVRKRKSHKRMGKNRR